MSTRRGVTRRDLPSVCVFYAVLILPFAIVFSFPDNHRLAKDSELQFLSGRVENVFHKYGRDGNYFNLHIEASDGSHRLTQEDLLSETIPAMFRFAPGDLVTAEVRHDSRNGMDWCWELTRNGQEILTYAQTERYLQQTTSQDKRLGHVVDEIAIVLFGALLTSAFLLRRHYGGWIDKHAELSIEQQVSESPN